MNLRQKANLKYRKFWLWVGYGGLATIAWLSITPLVVNVVNIRYSDLLLHLLAYGCITFWFVQLYPSRAGQVKTTLLIIAYSAMMEIAQSFTATRSMEWLDMLANTAGACIGSALAILLIRMPLAYSLERLMCKIASLNKPDKNHS